MTGFVLVQSQESRVDDLICECETYGVHVFCMYLSTGALLTRMAQTCPPSFSLSLSNLVLLRQSVDPDFSRELAGFFSPERESLATCHRLQLMLALSLLPHHDGVGWVVFCVL